jgi:Xaa-Pro aminopeptidase
MRDKVQVRIRKIFQNIDGTHIPECIFIYNRDQVDRNFLYVTGLRGGVFENCGVLCEKDGSVTIFSTTLEEEILRGAEDYARLVIYKNEKERNEQLGKALSRYSCIGISFGSISHSFYINLHDLLDGTGLIDVDGAFRKSRMIKTDEEITLIRKACEIASAVADEFPRYLGRGVTERDLATEVDYCMRKHGARRSAFETIVAFSPNNSKPHYSGKDVALKPGDTVLLDFGADYEGYVSDITRTYLTGKPDTGLKNCYETVLHAQHIALDLIGDGVSAEQVEKEVKSYIDSHERFRNRFIHGLGHSIGLSVHDNSYPGPEFNKTFREGMVLTVEPGIYLPGEYGVRIEDDILVKSDSCAVLTTARKELEVNEI